MNDYLKKMVATVMAAMGTMLVAYGVVDAEAWAAATSPEVVAGVAGVVGVMVYGVWNRMVDWAWSAFRE